MEEKMLFYKVITTIWDIAKKYSFGELNDYVWEEYIKETSATVNEFKQYGEPTWYLIRDIVRALTAYMERRIGHK